MNFDSRISEMNQLNSDQQLLNNSTNPSNSLFDGHIQKYPLSPMINSNYNNVHEDSIRKNFELWKIELDENNRKVGIENVEIGQFILLTSLSLTIDRSL
jgi:hypothetical protein